MSNEAAERITRLNDKIMKVWGERAVAEITAAKPDAPAILRNSLPEFLERIAVALSSRLDRNSSRANWDHDENTRVGQKHGKDRALNTEYSIDQLIFEYHILRQVIFDVMEEEKELSSVEREVIICAVEQAVNDAVTQYDKTHREIKLALTNALAHDLRGPITSAKLNAQQILKNLGISNPNGSIARRICTSMDRLDLMIHDLLDASKLRGGETLDMPLEDCDISEITKLVADEENFLNDNKIQVKTPGAVIGHWNSNGLQRVLDNLITNALKYSTPKSPITVEIIQRDQEVEVSVHNVGNPIAAEEIPTLFQQFSRASTSEGKTGWGLGLTVVKGITEAHGGRVEVQSNEVDGTTFRIFLPLMATSAAASFH